MKFLSSTSRLRKSTFGILKYFLVLGIQDNYYEVKERESANLTFWKPETRWKFGKFKGHERCLSLKRGYKNKLWNYLNSAVVSVFHKLHQVMEKQENKTLIRFSRCHDDLRFKWQAQTFSQLNKCIQRALGNRRIVEIDILLAQNPCEEQICVL